LIETKTPPAGAPEFTKPSDASHIKARMPDPEFAGPKAAK